MTTVPAKLFSGGLTAAEWHRGLGDVPLHRVRMIPPPGTATEADAYRISETERRCELVNGTIVETGMSAPEGFLATLIGYYLNCFVIPHRLGAVIGADAQFRMLHGNLRLPDVSYTRRERMPNPIPQVGGWCPDLCVEVLSPSNTAEEMTIKRREYFASGCQLVWEVEPRTRTAIAYSDADTGTPTGVLDGGIVLPGFTLPLANLFAEFELGMSPPV